MRKKLRKDHPKFAGDVLTVADQELAATVADGIGRGRYLDVEDALEEIGTSHLSPEYLAEFKTAVRDNLERDHVPVGFCERCEVETFHDSGRCPLCDGRTG